MHIGRRAAGKRAVSYGLYALLLALVSLSNCFGQDKFSFDFDKREILKPTNLAEAGISMSVTQDKATISTLYDRFLIDLQKADDGLSKQIFTGFRVPVKTVKGKKFISYKQDLRFTVNKDAGSRVVLIIDVGGILKTIEFPYGKKINAEFFRSFPQKLANADAIVYTATMGLIVERRDPKNVVFVQIDGVDLLIN